MRHEIVNLTLRSRLLCVCYPSYGSQEESRISFSLD